MTADDDETKTPVYFHHDDETKTPVYFHHALVVAVEPHCVGDCCHPKSNHLLVV